MPSASPPPDAPPPPPPDPGTVWWCDGAALAWEAHFKRRPVLVLTAPDPDTGGLLVAPLSSRRRHGQERAVSHDGGVSFLTGAAVSVPPAALVKPLGRWAGFDAWRAEQEEAAAAGERAVARWRAFVARVRSLLGSGDG